jgi:hypothetical protein
MKFKLAHLRADKGRWSASTEAQRRNLIKILKQVTKDLEREAAADAKAASRKTARVHVLKPAARNGKHSRAA